MTVYDPYVNRFDRDSNCFGGCDLKIVIHDLKIVIRGADCRPEFGTDRDRRLKAQQDRIRDNHHDLPKELVHLTQPTLA